MRYVETPEETITKKLFTTDEFNRMLDAEILPIEGKFELIRGEIIEMLNPGGRHSGRVNKLTRVFTSRLGEAVIVSVQNPVHLDKYSEPKPDITLLKPLPELFGDFLPGGEEVLLLVEISNTSVHYDTNVKAPLYAETGIREYWILKINQGVIEVHADPAEGRYQRVEVFRRGETISPQALPSFTFTIDELLD